MSKDHHEDTELFIERLKTINGRVSTTFSDRSNPSTGQSDCKAVSNDFCAFQSLQTSQKKGRRNLDEICTNLNETRRARGYQFYFDKSDLEIYREQKSSPRNTTTGRGSLREFGTELNFSSNQEQCFLSRRKSFNSKR